MSEKDIIDALKTLKVSKASGPDGISPRMLKHTALSISPVLAKLFNLSLQTSYFPLIWKQANVIPVFKKGNPNLTSNYRPVSLLSVVGKVFEKTVFKYFFNYLHSNNIIYEYQTGFLPGCSTTHHLVHLYHTICEALDKKKKVRMVFGDISKAFDRVWHKGLLFKLKRIDIDGALLRWFESYLSHRTQRVVLQGCSSDWRNIGAGVPQGSVLGPIMFLV